MKKDLAIHFSFMIALFILISLFKGWIKLDYLPFWLGGILGTLLPDIDHLIYVYILRPGEAASQKVVELASQRKVFQTWDLLSATRIQRTNLIFHSAHFQIIFVFFALLVITSSGSLLGRGLVLAFLLHILIDEIVDLMETGNLDVWFRKIPVVLDAEQKRWFLIANGLILLLLGFLL